MPIKFFTFIDYMGAANNHQGVCGFTSALYAVYMNRPEVRPRLVLTMVGKNSEVRLRSEIKTFLSIMKDEHNAYTLKEITELSRILTNDINWSVDSFINTINNTTTTPILPRNTIRIGMPPGALMLYMQRMWGIRTFLTNKPLPGDAILGLTCNNAMPNKWKNITHYVYQDKHGVIYNARDQFKILSDLSKNQRLNYVVVYRIMIHGNI